MKTIYILCLVCNVAINTSKGFQSIEQHSLTFKHGKNARIKLNSNQQQRLSSASTRTSEENLITTNINRNQADDRNRGRVPLLALLNSSDCAKKADLMWCMKNVVSDFSVNSNCDIEEVFRAMFPEVPARFCLSASKTRYTRIITDCLGPYFTERLLNDLKDEYFTLQFDETTNPVGKELQFAIRYWSPFKNEVVVRHLETFFFGTSTF
jgi:hypothetical protein